MAKLIKGNESASDIHDGRISSEYLFTKYNVTVCERCSAWIASDRSYGRLPSKDSPTICECCE